MIEQSHISSRRLGIDAYRRSQGRDRLVSASKSFDHVPADRDGQTGTAAKTSNSARKIKSQVLRSLHDQSNSGMVSMRDVAAALDKLLENSKN